VSATDAINWANDRIGVSEDPPGSNKGPWITQWQVDSGYPYVVNRSHGEPWCQCFVNAVAVHGGAPQLHTGFTPAVIVGIGDFRPISLSSAEPGAAFVFFKWPGVSNYRCDHVGVYKSHTYSTVTCWEGNTSKAGSQNNGGAVLLKTRSLGLLAGVVSIPYNNEAYRNLLLGMTGSDVRAFQVAINKRAVGCGRGASKIVASSSTESTAPRPKRTARGPRTSSASGIAPMRSSRAVSARTYRISCATLMSVTPGRRSAQRDAGNSAAGSHHGRKSTEMSRWQGAVDQALKEHTRRLDGINGDAKVTRAGTEQLLIEVAVLRTKVALWASLGGIVGAGVVSVIVAIVTG
jgi:hypothetical protein